MKNNNEVITYHLPMSPLIKHDDGVMHSPPALGCQDVNPRRRISSDDMVMLTKPPCSAEDTLSNSTYSSSEPPPSPIPDDGRRSAHTRRRSSVTLSPILMSLLRRNSKSSAHAPSSYAGPVPLDRHGNPLKSCLAQKSTIGRGVHHHKVVCFSHVSVREYSRVVGDNPCVCTGPPLAIGWKYNKRGKTEIDSFEADKLTAKAAHLDDGIFGCERLSADEREKLLIDIGGANHSQIMKGSMQAHYDNKLRWQSFDRLGGENHYKSIGPRERVLIMKESARRKFDRACKGTSSSQEQQDLWDHALEVSRRKLQQPHPDGCKPTTLLRRNSSA